jgi:acyl-coenzyme A synthetase/AMP-(fatty) acid ligase
MDVSSLVQVGSAGSPLSAELHHWFASNFPAGLALFSGSGGTDLVGGSEYLLFRTATSECGILTAVQLSLEVR